jgi:hypothetical protein
VLIHDGRILNRHFPAGEINHPTLMRAMPCVKWSVVHPHSLRKPASQDQCAAFCLRKRILPRLTSFPRRRESSVASWIPACAGMTINPNLRPDVASELNQAMLIERRTGRSAHPTGWVLHGLTRSSFFADGAAKLRSRAAPSTRVSHPKQMLTMH